MKKEQLINANSSGQGLYPDHVKHPLHATVLELGYTYSHTTNVGTIYGDGWHLLHTYFYKDSEHSVTLRDADRGDYREPVLIWSTKCNGGTGHEWDGRGEVELRAHLQSKRRRYDLTLA